MRAAIIDSAGVVHNVILVEDLMFDPGEGLSLIQLSDDVQVSAAYIFANGTFTPPAPTPPETLTRMEFLERLGKDNWAALKRAATQNVDIDFQMERARAAEVIIRADALPFLQMVEQAGIIAPGSAEAVWS